MDDVALWRGDTQEMNSPLDAFSLKSQLRQVTSSRISSLPPTTRLWYTPTSNTFRCPKRTIVERCQHQDLHLVHFMHMHITV